jgi:hypothetical protein
VNNFFKLITSLLPLVCVACSANVEIGRVAPESENAKCSPTGAVAGVPFRVPAIYTLRVYQLKGKSYVPVESAPFVRKLPDPCELFTLSFGANALSDQTMALKFDVDGTLDLLDMKETQKLDEAITDVGGQAVDLFAAVQGRELTELQAQKAALEARKQVVDAEAALAASETKPATDQANASGTAMIAALEALNAARAAERSLDAAVRQGATDAERAALEDALRLARLKANDAYRKAGLPIPFPDIFP